MSAGADEPMRQVCTFFLDGQLFGIDVSDVQEVIRYQEMTRVPLAPKVVSGLINLRGQIVTALDLRARLGLPPHADGALPTNIVLRLDGVVVSLLVDEVGEVVSVDQASFEHAPGTVDAAEDALVDGVYKLPQQLLLLLNSRAATRVDAARRTDHA